jgi:GABA(A) receptor-associated protein
MTSYINSHPIEKLQAESSRMMEKYPERIPVIVEKDPKSDIEDIDKIKYLVPENIKYGQFLSIIRKRIKLNPEKGLFVFVSDVMLNSTEQTMKELWTLYKHESGFLVLTYAGENTFG